MQVMLILFAALLILEQLLWLPFLWGIRVPLAILNLWLLAAWFGASLGIERDTWLWLLGIVILFKSVNFLRIIDNRMARPYIYRVARRASWVLTGLQLMILGAQKLNALHGSGRTIRFTIAVISLLSACLVLAIFLRNVRNARPRVSRTAYADRDLPTLTVAIPARNETEDLEACLQSLLTSTYPKLEIIVLDDCSQERRTPEIIRGYAHDGVRFVAGSVPPDDWLSKNYAYAQLTSEANGELLLFAGVDVRFTPDSLKSIVTSLLESDQRMLSFLPKNDPPKRSAWEALFVQPSRYAWELALPRRILPRPPVLSTCWIIRADTLHDAGGFESVKRGSQPEGYFAKRIRRLHGGYGFAIANSTIGLESRKSFDEQRATAIRTRYPQLHRRLELVLLLSTAEFLVLVGPYLAFVWAVLQNRWVLSIIYATACIVLNIFYSLTVRLAYRKFLFRGLWLAPFAAVYDIALLNYSMLRYEFGDVLWKGRNVCIPVMRVIPHLPPVDR